MYSMNCINLCLALRKREVWNGRQAIQWKFNQFHRSESGSHVCCMHACMHASNNTYIHTCMHYIQTYDGGFIYCIVISQVPSDATVLSTKKQRRKSLIETYLGRYYTVNVCMYVNVVAYVTITLQLHTQVHKSLIHVYVSTYVCMCVWWIELGLADPTISATTIRLPTQQLPETTIAVDIVKGFETCSRRRCSCKTVRASCSFLPMQRRFTPWHCPPKLQSFSWAGRYYMYVFYFIHTTQLPTAVQFEITIL